MKYTRLNYNYGRYNDANLDLKAQSIISSLTNNANFPETTPTLSNFTTVANTYATCLTAAASRDRVAVSLKNDARDAILGYLRLLAINVESLAEGNRSKLISSGFDLATESEGSAMLGLVTGFVLSDGMNPGEIKFSIKAVANAKSYIFEYTEEPLTADSKWISKGSSKREFTFTNLPQGKRIYGRVTAIGTRGQETTSNILSRVVQ
jgi:hypothetical protein